MRYIELKQKQQDEINNFPMAFAFSDKQLENAMQQLGVTSTDELLSIGGGGLIRKSDRELLKQLSDRQEKELWEHINADKTGDGFIYDMFLYELDNHEYIITYDVEETLDALGLSRADIEHNPALKHGLKKAIDTILSREQSFKQK